MNAHLRLLLVLITFSFGQITIGQHIQISFDGADAIPNEINVCGDSRIVRVRIQKDINQVENLTNVTANLKMIEGIDFISFVSNQSNTGIQLTNRGSSNATFSIPEIADDPVIIAYEIAANCSISDTLLANPNAIIRDEWVFQNIDFNQELFNTEYKDAINTPFLNFESEDIITTGLKNNIVERTFTITNTSLLGQLDSFYYQLKHPTNLSYQSITINGTEVTLTKTEIGTDTFINIPIHGSLFTNNQINDINGNNDFILDPNEKVTITERLVLNNCNSDNASTHTISWGCDNSSCTQSEINAAIRIGQGAPNPSIEPQTSTNNQEIGYCNDGAASFLIVNNGQETDELAGAMFDISVSVAQGSLFNLDSNGYTLTDLNILGQSVALSNSNMIQLADLFNTDPDGDGGLDDLDGDGFYDDLSINESFLIEFDYTLDINNSADNNCNNSLNTNFRSFIRYNSGCQDDILEGVSIIDITNSSVNIDYESPTDVDAIRDTFAIITSLQRNLTNFKGICSNQGFNVAIDIPQGVNILLDSTQLLRNEQVLNITNQQIINDSLIVSFDYNGTFLNGIYSLKIAAAADCSSNVGKILMPFTFDMVCSDCNVTHRWLCGDMEGPVVHKTTPPCLVSEVNSCDNNIKTLSFDVERQSIGFQNSDLSTPANPDNVNLSVALSLDTVQLSTTGVIGSGAIGNNIAVQIHHQAINASSETIFEYINGALTIIQSGVAQIIPVDLSNFTNTFNSNIHLTEIELSSILNSNGITLNTGDSLRFISHATIRTEPITTTQFEEIADLRSNFSINQGGTWINCEDDGAPLTIGKVNTFFNYPSSGEMPSGCNNIELDYTLILQNEEYRDYFENEFRAGITIDSLAINYDPALFSSFSNVEISLQIPTSNGQFQTFEPLNVKTNENQFLIVFENIIDNDINLNELLVNDAATLRVTVSPDCQSDNENLRLFGLNFSPTWHYSIHKYADNALQKSIAHEGNTNITYHNSPALDISPLDNVSIPNANNDLSWEFSVCNTTNIAVNSFIIQLKEISNGIEIIDITDITDSNSPQSISIENFSIDKYFQGNSLNSSLNCRKYRITANSSNCNDQLINISAFWSCVANNNIESFNFDCDTDQLSLRATSEDAFIDSDVIQQPLLGEELCNEVPVSILIKNIGRQDLKDLSLKLMFPNEGVDWVANSFEYEYPLGAARQRFAQNPISTASTSFTEDYIFENLSYLGSDISTEGLKAFSSILSEEKDQLFIHFNITTNCDLTIGDLIRYEWVGTQICDEQVTVSGETYPLLINNAPTDANFDIKVISPAEKVTQNSTGTYTFAVNVLSNNNIGQNHFIEIILPNYLTADENSLSSLGSTELSFLGSTINSLGNNNILRIPLPENISNEDDLQFSIDISNSINGCEDQDAIVGFRTISPISVNCASGNNSCETFAISSINGTSSFDFTIISTPIQLSNVNTKISCNNAGLENSISASIVNNTSQNINTTINLIVFEDINNNNTFQPGTDNIVHSFTPISSIPAQETIVLNEISANSLCNTTLRWQLNGINDLTNSCTTNNGSIPEPIYNIAGDDQFFCVDKIENSSTQIGKDCNNIGSNFSWEAILPATIDMLSDATIAQPTVNFVSNPSNRDTLKFVLTTDIASCGQIKDTVNIIRGEQFKLIPINDQSVPEGETIELSVIPVAKNSDIYTYQWTPIDDIQNPNIASVKITPTQNETYKVVVTGSSGCSTEQTFDIGLENNCKEPILTLSKIVGSRDDEPTGIIDLTFDDLINDFNLTWSPIPNNIAQDGKYISNLASGFHRLEIESKSVSECIFEYDFAVPNQAFPDILELQNLPATCGQSNGVTELSPISFNYIWEDGVQNNFRDDLAAGQYRVEIQNGSLRSFTVVTIDEVNQLNAEITTISNPTQNSLGSLSAALTNGEASTYLWSTGETTQEINNLSEGIYSVIIKDINGCSTSTLSVLAENKIGSITTNIQHETCYDFDDGKINFSIQLPEEYDFNQEIVIIDDENNIHNKDSLSPGNYCLIAQTLEGEVLNSECFTIEAATPFQSSITTLRDCPENTHSLIVQNKGGSKPYTYFWNDIGNSSIQGRQNVPSGTYQYATFDSKNCRIAKSPLILESCPEENCSLSPTGLPNEFIRSNCSNNSSTVCIEQFDASFFQTKEIFFKGTNITEADNCNPKSIKKYNLSNLEPIISDSIQLNNWIFSGQPYDAVFSSFGAIADSLSFWTNQVWTYEHPFLFSNANIDFADLEFNAINSSLNISIPYFNVPSSSGGTSINLTSGVNEIIVFDRTTSCYDTLIIELQCGLSASENFSDTILLGEVVDVCYQINDFNIGTEIISITNLCPNKSGQSVDFETDDDQFCITYAGSKLGLDTACIEFCGNTSCDTIEYQIWVQKEADIIEVEIFEGQVGEVCTRPFILPGTEITIDLFCAEKETNHVDVEITPNFCLSYTGISIGTDNVCVSICDETNICDTSYVYFSVTTVDQTPIVRDDIDSTLENTPVIIDIESNDDVFGDFETTLLPNSFGPFFGEAVLNLDGSIRYTPNENTCGQRDEFQYQTCNEIGCDTATVQVVINCEGSISVFRVISPNGDDVNDVFYVAGLERFENNELFIYNRWGELVYSAKSYQNDWNGVWQGNKRLPDGTYFYYLKLNDGLDTILEGYIELYR